MGACPNAASVGVLVLPKRDWLFRDVSPLKHRSPQRLGLDRPA